MRARASSDFVIVRSIGKVSPTPLLSAFNLLGDERFSRIASASADFSAHRKAKHARDAPIAAQRGAKDCR